MMLFATLSKGSPAKRAAFGSGVGGIGDRRFRRAPPDAAAGHPFMASISFLTS